MKTVLAWAINARKFLAALSGAAGVATSVGLLNGTPQRWVTGAVAVAVAFVVYFIENESPPAKPDVPAVAEVPPPPQPEAPFSGGH